MDKPAPWTRYVVQLALTDSGEVLQVAIEAWDAEGDPVHVHVAPCGPFEHWAEVAIYLIARCREICGVQLQLFQLDCSHVPDQFMR